MNKSQVPRAFQILHSTGYLRCHVYDLLEVQIHAVTFSHILEQRAIAHVLSDYENGFANRAHTPKLDKLFMSEFLHDLELLAELFFASLLFFRIPLLLIIELERFDGDHEPVPPQTFVHFAKVASANEWTKLDVDPVLLPHVLEANKAGHFGARFGECAAKAVGCL